MNINASLLIGLALKHAEKKQELSQYDRKFAELRVYPDDAGEGFFFTTARASRQWYFKEHQKADHYNAANMESFYDVIESGAKVQLIGDRGRIIGTWHTFGEFACEVGNKIWQPE
jgi:hypothetical protein